MILLIDNYDSFVANIARYFRRMKQTTHVVRNDALDASQVMDWNPSAVVISPGPCTPDEAGQSKPIINTLAGKVPMLGICLGHQAIGSVFGAEIKRANEPYHGRQSTLTHSGHALFKGIPEKFDACRYHSLVIDESSLSPQFEITCRTADQTIMGIADDARMLFGLQFHPESILTPFGFQILQNFVELIGLATPDSDHSLFDSEAFPGQPSESNRMDAKYNQVAQAQMSKIIPQDSKFETMKGSSQ